MIGEKQHLGNTKSSGMRRILFGLAIFFGLIFILKQFSNPNSLLEKTKVVMQSQEERFGCKDGEIEKTIIAESPKVKTTFVVMEGIRTNKVEYPLNKDIVMMEYCFRVGNYSSELGGVLLNVKFLDKDKNVLSEEDERVTNIPGKRIKTVYGYQMVNTKLANEITGVLIGE